MKLINAKTGKEVRTGDIVTDPSGEKYIVKDFQEPKKGCSGTIDVTKYGSSQDAEERFHIYAFSLVWTNEPALLKPGDKVARLTWRHGADTFHEMWEAVLRERKDGFLSFEGMDQSGNPVWADVPEEDIVRC